MLRCESRKDAMHSLPENFCHHLSLFWTLDVPNIPAARYVLDRGAKLVRLQNDMRFRERPERPRIVEGDAVDNSTYQHEPVNAPRGKLANIRRAWPSGLQSQLARIS